MGRQAYHKARHAGKEEKKWKERKKKMWVHHVCKWECRRRLRHPKRLSEKKCDLVQKSESRITCTWIFFVKCLVHLRKRSLDNVDISYKFASKFIPHRAFHNAISRPCILLLFNTNRKKMIKNCNTYTKLRIILLSLSFYASRIKRIRSWHFA